MSMPRAGDQPVPNRETRATPWRTLSAGQTCSWPRRALLSVQHSSGRPTFSAGGPSHRVLAGPARGRETDIALGDFNSAADGSATHTYAALTKRFRDGWLANDDSGLTCCQDQKQTNLTSKLATRIDLVLSRRGAKAVKTRRVGVTPFQASPAAVAIRPRWRGGHPPARLIKQRKDRASWTPARTVARVGPATASRTTVGHCVLRTTVGHCVLRTTAGQLRASRTTVRMILVLLAGSDPPHD